MTLPSFKYIISNAEPADVDSGTELLNTVVMSILPLKYSSIIKEQTSITGLPIVRTYGQKAPTINIVLHVLETAGATWDADLGLTDLDALRQMQIGLSGGVTGKTVWIRITNADYFFHSWKGGYLRGLDIDIKEGYNNIASDTLYIVSFSFVCPLNLGNNHTLLRWI